MSSGRPSWVAGAEQWIVDVHESISAFFVECDGGSPFAEENWLREAGGGGVSRVIAGGETFEKAGFNRSSVGGALEPEMARRLALLRPPPDGTRFFATGVSVVAHPRSPRIPTVHLNVRYFELVTPDGESVDAWFGGGTDLTPTYPSPEDAQHFHGTLRDCCDRHDDSSYPRFKSWCDDYFRNLHRDGEARGVGGVFFDHLRPESWPGGFTALHRFVNDIGRILPEAYGPIVERQRHAPWGMLERELQLFRRGRYAEFNLLHDRGTSFGLSSGARTESVLMSLPPLAAWDGTHDATPGSLGFRLAQMLRPQAWAPARIAVNS